MRLDVPTPPLALTFDLDDTLWPIWPTIRRAEQVLRSWLEEAAPATAARFDAGAMRDLREAIVARHPQWAHDLGRQRLETLREAMRLSGDDPALAQAAYDCFMAERQRVDLYEDARPSLERLSRRFPLFALSNGNADLARIGLQSHFVGALSASAFGRAKPDPAIFREACRQLGAAPEAVLHVGDDLRLDVHGAVGAGLRAVWLARDTDGDGPEPPPGVLRVPDLLHLADALGC